MSDWQDIKTAPKDGTLILIKEDRGRVQVAQWQTNADGYSPDWFVQLSNNGEEGVGNTFPTMNVVKWMPIPNEKAQKEGS